MKKILLILVFAVLTASQALAETPESLAMSYFNLLKTRQWDNIGSLYDPGTLQEFRESMSFLGELPDESSSDVLSNFFGPGTTRESLKAMTDAQFFSGFLQGVLTQTAQLGQFDFKKIDVLGSIAEGDGIRHVVTRTSLEVGDISLESMEVISFKKTEAGWKILLQGKIKGIAQQIRKVLAQSR